MWTPFQALLTDKLIPGATTAEAKAQRCAEIVVEQMDQGGLYSAQQGVLLQGAGRLLPVTASI